MTWGKFYKKANDIYMAQNVTSTEAKLLCRPSFAEGGREHKICVLTRCTPSVKADSAGHPLQSEEENTRICVLARCTPSVKAERQAALMYSKGCEDAGLKAVQKHYHNSGHIPIRTSFLQGNSTNTCKVWFKLSFHLKGRLQQASRSHANVRCKPSRPGAAIIYCWTCLGTCTPARIHTQTHAHVLFLHAGRHAQTMQAAAYYA